MSAKIVNQQLQLSFTEWPGAANYKIYLAAENSDDFVRIKTTTDLSYSCAKYRNADKVTVPFNVGEKYRLKVRAILPDGSIRSESNIVTIKISEVLKASSPAKVIEETETTEPTETETTEIPETESTETETTETETPETETTEVVPIESETTETETPETETTQTETTETQTPETEATEAVPIESEATETQPGKPQATETRTTETQTTEKPLKGTAIYKILVK